MINLPRIRAELRELLLEDARHHALQTIVDRVGLHQALVLPERLARERRVALPDLLDRPRSLDGLGDGRAADEGRHEARDVIAGAGHVRQRAPVALGNDVALHLTLARSLERAGEGARVLREPRE